MFFDDCTTKTSVRTNERTNVTFIRLEMFMYAFDIYVLFVLVGWWHWKTDIEREQDNKCEKHKLPKFLPKSVVIIFNEMVSRALVQRLLFRLCPHLSWHLMHFGWWWWLCCNKFLLLFMQFNCFILLGLNTYKWAEILSQPFSLFRI